MLRWRFEREHAYHLTQPEVARYLIETTKELAHLLGISLAEGERGEQRLNPERGGRFYTHEDHSEERHEARRRLLLALFWQEKPAHPRIEALADNGGKKPTDSISPRAPRAAKKVLHLGGPLLL